MAKTHLKTIGITEKNASNGYYATKFIEVFYDDVKQVVERYTVPKKQVKSASVGRTKYPENNQPSDETIFSKTGLSSFTTLAGITYNTASNEIYALDSGTNEFRVFEADTGEEITSKKITLTNTARRANPVYDIRENRLVYASDTSNTLRVYNLDDNTEDVIGGTALSTIEGLVYSPAGPVVTSTRDIYINTNQAIERAGNLGTSIVDISVLAGSPTFSELNKNFQTFREGFILVASDNVLRYYSANGLLVVSNTDRTWQSVLYTIEQTDGTTIVAVEYDTGVELFQNTTFSKFTFSSLYTDTQTFTNPGINVAVDTNQNFYIVS